MPIRLPSAAPLFESPESLYRKGLTGTYFCYDEISENLSEIEMPPWNVPERHFKQYRDLLQVSVITKLL